MQVVYTIIAHDSFINFALFTVCLQGGWLLVLISTLYFVYSKSETSHQLALLTT